MTHRRIKRNAHACSTLAGAWFLVSLFAWWDWHDAHRYFGGPQANINLSIWAIQLFLIILAAYFHQTETPGDALWFGDARETATVIIPAGNAAYCLNRLTNLPQLETITVALLIEAAHSAATEDESFVNLPITFRGRTEELWGSFECIDGVFLEIRITTHADLVGDIEKVFADFQSSL